MTADNDTYLKRARRYGEGEIRIGKRLLLEEDIYSIGFIAQISDQEMEKYLDIITG